MSITWIKSKTMFYNLLCGFQFWYLILFHAADKKRASSIHERHSKFLMSSLYIFLISLVISFTLSVNFGLPFLIIFFTFGMNLPLTMLIINREGNNYYNYLKIEREQKSKIETDGKEVRDREREFLFKEQMKTFTEHMRREQERKREKYEKQRENLNNQSKDNIISSHLRTLGLNAECRDLSLVKKTYRELMKKYHPDVNKSANAQKVTIKIIDSYKELKKLL